MFVRTITRRRALAEEDSEGGGPGPVAEAAGAMGAALYQSGTLQQSKMPLVVYLSRKAGMFPDVAEQLVAKHLAKDDMMSALITSDWSAPLHAKVNVKPTRTDSPPFPPAWNPKAPVHVRPR